MSDYIDLDALWQVLVLGLAFGVGVVVVFTFGVLGTVRAGGPASARRQGGRVLAVVCFAACLAAIAFSLYVMLDK